MPDATVVLDGRFELGALLASGGMGDVYLAHDRRDDRTVVVKRVRDVAGEHDIERLAHEGAILRATAHPSIVPVLAVLADASGPSIVMEYVRGGTLADLIASAPLPIDRVLYIALDLADALSRAHRLGIIHHDIKPSNVLLADDGSPRLTDFGIASVAGIRDGIARTAIIGSLHYLPPEAWDGEPLDVRADIWSFGVMLYEMLTGKRPFTGSVPGLLHAAIATAEPPSVQQVRPDVPDALARALSRMLAKRPAQRMASIRELGVIIDRLLHAPVPDNARKLTFDRRRVPLIGRAAEQAELAMLLRDRSARLVTLSGPGGCGKTRLAIAVAEALSDQFGDGVRFVDLSAVPDDRLVVPAIARALGVEDDLEVPLLDDIVRFIGDSECLLVLDNFEQVLGAAAAVARLVALAPHLTVLVTSRFPLRLTSEQVVKLDPLPVPDRTERSFERLADNDAVRLFVSSARARGSDFRLDHDNAWTVAEICRRLDGLPLAIELAAARTGAYAPAQILGLLQAPLAVLKSPDADRTPRQQTLRAAIDWSATLLLEAERRLFTRLSIFAGSFTFADGLAVAAEEGDDAALFVDRLQALVEKNLITVRHSPEDTRYAMLVTVRAWAGEKLAGGPDAATMVDRHLAHFANLAAGWHERTERDGLRRTIDDFNEAIADFRTALDHAEGSDGPVFCRMAGALGRFWYLAGHWNEARQRYARALEIDCPDASRSLVLDELARLEMFLGDETSATRHHEQATLLATRSGDRALEARTAEGFGEVLLKVGDTRAATHQLERAEALARSIGPDGLLAQCLTTLATARVAVGQYSDAEHLLDEARQLADARRDALLLVRIYYYVGGLALLRRDIASARAACSAGIIQAGVTGDTSWGCHLDEMLARVCAEEGDLRGAARMVAHSLSAFDAVGSRSCLPHSFEAAARLRRVSMERDDLLRSAELLGAADAVCDALRIVMLPVERALFGQTVERVRDGLPPEVFQAAWDSGRRLPEPDAVRLASELAATLST